MELPGYNFSTWGPKGPSRRSYKQGTLPYELQSQLLKGGDTGDCIG